MNRFFLIFTSCASDYQRAIELAVAANRSLSVGFKNVSKQSDVFSIYSQVMGSFSCLKEIFNVFEKFAKQILSE